jgi:hypothetical protein
VSRCFGGEGRVGGGHLDVGGGGGGFGGVLVNFGDE